MKILLPLISIFVLATACSNESDKKTDRSQILGDWQAHSMRITFNNFSNKDSLSYFEVPEGKWESRMQIQPPLFVYDKDGTYHSYDRDLSGAMKPGAAGRWEIFEDSISIRDTFPALGKTYRYKIEFAGKQVRMWGKEDCDNDGKEDDQIFSVMQRLK